MFVIPVDSYFGLMFVERIGLRHLREVIRSEAVVPAAHATGTVIHVESFAEAKDWESLLKPQQTLRVTEILEVRESGHDSSTASAPTMVRIVAEGGLVAMASEKIKRTVLDRVLNREHRFDTMAALAPLKEREANPNGCPPASTGAARLERSPGQGYRDPCAGGVVGDVELSSVDLDDVVDDGEPEANSAGVACASVVESGEPFEHPSPLRLGNAGTVVGDGELSDLVR